MPTMTDPAKLADAQVLVDKLIDLPQDALLYIAGYVEGCRDRTKDKKTEASTNVKPHTNQAS